MYGRSFSDENPLTTRQTSEYVFEGFNIELNEKVMLTSLVPGKNLAAMQSLAGAFVLEPGKPVRNEIPKAEFDRMNLDQDRLEARQRLIEDIKQLAAGSNLARFAWPGHGVAPLGYTKGMAVVFAKVLCKFRNGDAAAIEMAKASTGNAAVDALARFNPEFTAQGMANNVAGADTLRHLFVLMIGLGIRETEGRYCQGVFRPQGNFTANTAEAGVFQTSFNAGANNALMQQIFQDHQAHPAGFVEIFREGVNCTNDDLQNFGAGPGFEFQRLSKASPLFAAEFTAVGLRNNCLHWGPVLNKTLQIQPEADDLLTQVQNLLGANNCGLLLN